VRLVVLLRHAEYDTSPDGTFGLTERGREQARIAGTWLARRVFDRVLSSSLVRARETADIVAGSLGMDYKAMNLLAEGVPTPVRSLSAAKHVIAEDRERMERAFKRLFVYREDGLSDLVVCHANMIRYFVCRVLRAPVRRWTRMLSNHASVTEIAISHKGACRLLVYNQTAYLPEEMRT
jgi:serine/threonine-protein phosphatase PGAM5